MTTRRPSRLAAAALASAIALVAPASAGEPPPPVPPFAAETSDVAVVLSGLERGTLKPCGCTSPMMGGLPRRAALLDRLRASAKAVGAVSLGDSLAPGEATQNGLKAELLRSSLEAMGYAGMLLSDADLLQPRLVQPDGSDAAARPPLNVKISPGGMAAAAALVDPILRFQVGDLAVRAVSLVDPTAQDSLGPAGIADAVLPPAVALRALAKEKGLLIVVAHASREELSPIRAEAETKAEIVVVVDADGQVAYDRPVPRAVAKGALLVRFDEHAKEVGILALDRKDDAWWVAWRTVVLDPQFEEGASPGRDQVDARFAAYRKRLREDRVLDRLGAFQDGPAKFVGSAECKACHAAIYAQWQETAHARALTSLADLGYDWDPECVHCHTVGWSRGRAPGEFSRVASAWKRPDLTPHLSDVGCEDCHGPGSQHLARPDDATLFGAWGGRGTAVNWRTPGEKGCATCHDVENSPAFHAGYAKDFLPVVDHRTVPKEKRTTAPPAGWKPGSVAGPK